MDEHTGKGHLSVFLKMFLTFLLIITPLYFINLYVNHISRETIRGEIERSTISKIDFLLEGLEREFDGILLMQQSLMNDADLMLVSTDNLFLQQYERNKMLLNIQKKIVVIMNLSRYIEDAGITVPLIGKRISMTAIADIGEEEVDALERAVRSNGYPFYSADGSLYINMAAGNRVVVNRRFRPGFLISIEISRPVLQETLQRMTTHAGSGAVLMSGGRGIDACSTGGMAPAEPLKAYLSGLENAAAAQSATLGMDGRKFIVIHKYSRLLDTTLAAYVPEEELYGRLSLYSVWTWVITLLTVAVIVLFALRMRRVVAQPLGRLIGAFGRLEQGNTDISVNYGGNDEFGYLYNRFNALVARFGDLVRQVYEEKLRTKDAELKQLQYQINPHFLYNTIYIIYRMAKAADLDAIMKLTLHLGDYYKFVSGNFSQAVPLVREWAHARDFVGIQSFRFSRRIAVEFGELPAGCQEIPVPRLILQPIVENAYKHGLKDMESGGVLKIRSLFDGSSFRAFVEDNGGGVDETRLAGLQRLLSGDGAPADGTGMVNVHRRLRIKYGGDSGLHLSANGAGGLCVEIRIEQTGGIAHG